MSRYDELLKAMDKVPFGNSVFQIEAFNLQHETPERAYRAALINLDSKLKSLKDWEFKKDRLEVDLLEIDEKIKSADTPKFDKMRLEIDKREKEYTLDSTIKLLKDAEIEAMAYYNVIKDLESKLPKEFDRLSFERSESVYWQKRLAGDAQRQLMLTGSVEQGTAKSLEQMGCPLVVESGQLKIANISPDLLIVDASPKQMMLPEKVLENKNEKE